MKRSSGTLLRVVLGVTLFAASAAAQAVPSFARQTGMPCSACHTIYPELTQFGRSFKLNGYTLVGGKQIKSEKSGGNAALKLAEIPPLSAMVQLSATNMQKQDSANNQNNNVGFPQQASLFFAGAITEHLGAFVQATYAQETGSFGWDNTDVRFADHWGSTIYGVTLNNNPSVQDLWNTTPAWGFPFSSSASSNTPAAGTLIDGQLAQDVGGLGVYALSFNHLYAEVAAYRSAHQGAAAAPTPASVNTVAGLAPYWRLAWQQNFLGSYLMVGTYGMLTSVYPTGIAGESDKYKDYALDAQFEHMFGTDTLAARATYIHEKKDLDATFRATGSSNASDSLNTWRVNGTYHFAGEYAASLGYFQTTGSTDALLYTASASNGSPDSRGEIVQGTYLPWQNVQIVGQYTIYNRFDGASSNYNGLGRGASDNNTLYVLLWLMW